MKNILLLFSGTLIFNFAVGQSLFTYSGKSVDQKEFLYSYQKNSTDSLDNKKALTNYLELYIRFKLKVQAALDLKMDTLPNQVADFKNFDEQIRVLYMMDSKTLDTLIQEAYDRSKMAIGCQHIFIAYNKNKINSKTETATVEEINAANQKAEQVKKRLEQGADFSQLAMEYSDDPSAKINKGYIGYIQAFDLPYFLENAVYGLSNNQVSGPIVSEIGQHFFKRVGSRPIPEKISVAHILLAVPEDADETTWNKKLSLADSIYKALQSGTEFEKMVQLYSDDRSTKGIGGLMEDAGSNTYDPHFTDQVYALKSDGAIGKPFQTSYGVHILKKIAQTSNQASLEEKYTELKELVMTDNRVQLAVNAFIKNCIGKFGLTQNEPNKKAYISKRLSEFSPAYAMQLKDFKEGNLLFEIMDKQIWGKAAQDVEGLKKFHASKANQYIWKKSADAMIITAKDLASAELIKESFLSDKSVARTIDRFKDIANIDTGRYEVGELPGVGNENAKLFFISSITENENDKTASFVILTKIHSDPSAKSFEQAKGQALNDYQQQLEEQWITALKKKYPVVVNQSTWKALLAERN
ncbi:MAG: hypothetical protein RL131_1170 [Bacteroidota bacterium]